MDLNFDIYNIIKNEKKNINNLNYFNLPKIFNKYYFKFILVIKKKFYQKFNNYDLFNTYINNISNLLFEIFWIIFLGTFNHHITIFFLERATILFYEFINLADENKNYKIQNSNIVYDGILFTFNKTLGNTTIKRIIKESNKNKNNLWKKINIIREWSYLSIIIINKTILYDIDNSKFKSINSLSIHLYSIVKHICINKYISFKFNSIFDNFNLEKSLFIIKILIDTLLYFIEINYFKFNNDDTILKNFINYFDNSIDNFIYDETFLNNDIKSEIIKKKNIYLNFKDSILRFINY